MRKRTESKRRNDMKSPKRRRKKKKSRYRDEVNKRKERNVVERK